MWSKLIAFCDIYSIQPKLKIQYGNNNFKQHYGGIISILAILTITATLVYFLYLFVTNQNFSISNISNYSNSKYLSSFNLFPLMIRLSDSNSLGYANNKNLYSFTMTYYIFNNHQYQNQNITFSQCDIDNPIHFNSNYRNIFVNYSDITSFYCPNWVNESYDIYGLYDEMQNFSYINIFAYSCEENTTISNDDNSESDIANDNSFCLPTDQIDSTLLSSFLDLRTISFNILNGQVNSFVPMVYNSRFSISNSMYERIWMYLTFVEYSTDNGFIFENYSTETSYFISNFRNDFITDQINNSYSTSFLTLTILFDKENMYVNRIYMKFQQFLAFLGGIIDFLLCIVFILNFIISEKLMNLYLINNVKDIKYSVDDLLEKDLEDISISESEISNNNKRRFSKRVSEKYSKKFNPIRLILEERKRKEEENNENNENNAREKNINHDTSNNIISQLNEFNNVNVNKQLEHFNIKNKEKEKEKDKINENEILEIEEKKVKEEQKESSENSNNQSNNSKMNSNLNSRNNSRNINNNINSNLQSNFNSNFQSRNQSNFSSNNMVLNINKITELDSKVKLKKEKGNKEIMIENKIKEQKDKDRDLNQQRPYKPYIDLVSIKNKKEITLTLCQLICPLFCCQCSKYQKKKSKVYKKQLSHLYYDMDITVILNRLNQLEKIKLLLMNQDQQNIFDYLFQIDFDDENRIYFEEDKYVANKAKIDYYNFESLLIKIDGKDHKNRFDKMILNSLF